jgi:hypothetical protein
MSTFMSVRVYLFVFSIDPIAIESVAPEWASFVICLVIALTVRAVTPVRAGLALRGGWDRWLAIRVTLAVACKFVMGILKVEFAALGAYWCPLGTVFIGVAPLPALPAKWGSY